MTSAHRVNRDLATALKGQSKRTGEQAPSVRGADWRTATVTAVGAGTITADGIVARCMEGYLPLVGDVAVISHSSNGNWIAFGRLSTGDPGWITPTLGTGYTQGNASTSGNNNGPVRYRRLSINGTWFMEWDGSANRSTGAQTSNILSAALASTYRPTNRASVVIARNATNISGVTASTSVVHSCKADFQQDGTISLVSAAAGGEETTWISFKGVRYPLD